MSCIASYSIRALAGEERLGPLECRQRSVAGPGAVGYATCNALTLMRHKLQAIWSRLLSTLWFVPSLIVIGSLGLGMVMVQLSAMADAEILARWQRLFGADAESSRSMLSAIAGSMITVAGVTFSITIVAVTQASSQYTPRILRNFMRDRSNQVVLGIFVGIFAYCLLVLRTIRSGEDYTFVPSFAVLLSIVLAIVGIGVLIFFVHHIASTLQASTILERVTRETVATIDSLFPESMGDELESDELESDELEGTELQSAAEALASAAWRAVPSRRTGYIQTLDEDGLLRTADEHGVVIRMEHGIGEFVVEGLPIAAFVPRATLPVDGSDQPRTGETEIGHAIAGQFAVSSYRTVDQDVSFGIRQLVDIALKALSPGINDTTTAVSCVDYLGAVLVRLSRRQVEQPYRARDGVLLVIACGPTFHRLLWEAVDEIRQNASNNVTVLARLLEQLSVVASVTRLPERRALIVDQMELVSEVVERTVQTPSDRRRLMLMAERSVVEAAAAGTFSHLAS